MRKKIVPIISHGSLTKARSPQEIRAWLKTLPSDFNPNDIFVALDKSIDEWKAGKATREEVDKKFDSAFMTISHEQHLLVAQSIVDERWRTMAVDLAIAIQNEYQCFTPSEVALAGLAASAYYRALRAARKVNGLLEQNTMGPICVQLLSFASKEVDRAERQYLAAIETLRNRRQPQINVKLHTKTAFFGNQTIHTQSVPGHYENNDPQ